MTSVRILALVLIVGQADQVEADEKPALDDFYERTRERDASFDDCAVGYCDGTFLATLRIGAQTATPSSPSGRALVGIGGRLGGELGMRRDLDLARTSVWVGLLRVDGASRWVVDAAWNSTVFKTFGRQRDDIGLHASLDNVVVGKTELDLADVARLNQVPYRMVDTECEVAPLGPYVDKDARIAVPIGLSNRLRWQEGPLGFDRKTAVSGALAFRGFVKQTRAHQQLDALRVKYTDWGDATATTISAGYQRLPLGIDTLPLWALVGYQWAGDRSGVVAQLGMDLPVETPVGSFRIAPSYARALDRERDSSGVGASFVRVSSAKLAVSHRVRQVSYGVTYEAVDLEALRAIHAITPTVALTWRALELGLGYRVVVRERIADPMAPALPQNRLSATLDQRF